MHPASDLPLIALTMGDPAGIGPEILLKALRSPLLFERCIPVILGDAGVMNRARLESGSDLELHKVANVDDSEPGRINILSLSSINLEDFAFGVARTDLGLTSTFYIIKAVELALEGAVDALVTAPINKASLRKAGYDYTSHSQMLRAVTGEPYTCTLLVGESVKIARVTSHAPMAAVPKLLSIELVLNALRQTSLTLIDHFSIEKPRLAVCALNPHAGEHGLFGHEDDDIIEPAVQAARREGIVCTSPMPADSVFPRLAVGDYDAAVCMYHDQAHIPFALLDSGFGVNLSLGLPIIRTAPEHGAAYDIAGKGYASETGMARAIELAARLASRRSRRIQSENETH